MSPGEPKVDELQAALREMDQMLQQMRSQRDVARRQCEDLRRRWNQEVSQYELRLNRAHLECERLRRQLERLANPLKSSRADDSPRVERPTLRPVRKLTATVPVAAEPHDRDLRYVFTRLRDRASCQ